jgi:TonB family protein
VVFVLALGSAAAGSTRLAETSDFPAALEGQSQLRLTIDRLEAVRDSALSPGVAWRRTVVPIAQATLRGDELAMLRSLVSRTDTVITDDFPDLVCDTCAKVVREFFTLRSAKGDHEVLLQVDPCAHNLALFGSRVGGTVGFNESDVGLVRFLVEMLKRAGKGGLAADSIDCSAYQRGHVAYATLCDVLSSARPEYPTQAAHAGISGTVLVDALVGTDGSVQAVHIRESIPELDQAAMASVRKWRFKPAMLHGAPRAVWVVCPVRFALP